MSKYTVHRTYLIRRVETWAVETDADLLDMDFGDADELVCDTGELLSADYEIADEDELSVEILPDESDAPILTLERIAELRTALEAEHISWGELAEIEGAFAEIDPATLPEPAENAMAGDMLDELERQARNVAHHEPTD